MVPAFILTILLVAIVSLLWCLRGFETALKQKRFVGILVRSAEATHVVDPAHEGDQKVGVKSRPESHSGMPRSRLELIAPDFQRQMSQKHEGYRSRHPADVA